MTLTPEQQAARGLELAELLQIKQARTDIFKYCPDMGRAAVAMRETLEMTRSDQP
jgi:hypothetical protein